MSMERNRQAEKTEEVASHWMVRRESSRWNEADQAELNAWLEESTAHQVAYLRAEFGSEKSERLKALGAGIPGDEPPPPGQWNLEPIFQAPDAPLEQPAHSRGRSWKPFAYAAAVLIAAFAGWQFFPAGEAFKTPLGGLAAVPLSDGSKATLNTASEIRVSLTATERHIDLKRGEVFIEAAEDPSRPFIVQAGDQKVRVLGTQFAVRREGGGVEVIVTEGRVQLQNAASGTDANLSPGAIARAGAEGIQVSDASVTEAEERLSWRTGVLVFRDRTLGEAVREFNRYNPRQFVIEDTAVQAFRISGAFRTTNIGAFSRLLQETYPVELENRPHDRVLIRPRRNP